MPGYTHRVADAIAAAAKHEHDFGGWLAQQLATAAAELGSTDALTAARPGSWEADLVQRLVKGTTGYDDEHLTDFKRPEPKPLEPGDQVRHRHSGWAGPVLSITDEPDPRIGDRLVAVRPTHPRPREVWVEGTPGSSGGFVPTPDDWTGWSPITVAARELERDDA